MAEGFDEARQFSNPTKEGSLKRIHQQDELKKEPYIAGTMVEIRRILDLKPGKRVVEFAAGALRNAIEIAKKVSPSGEVLALDLDKVALEEGKKLAQKEGVKVNTKVWDITEPIEASEFDGVMVDRALAHIPGYAKVVKNMADAVKPEGIVVAHEALWLPTSKYPGLTIDSSLDSINNIILENYSGSHGAPRLGKDIEQVFQEEGIGQIQTRLGFMVIDNIGRAFFLAGIDTVLANLVQPKDGSLPKLTKEQSDAWREEQKQRALRGEFKFSLPFLLIWGKKI